MERFNRVIVVKDGKEILNEGHPNWSSANDSHATLEEQYRNDRSVDVQLWVREA